jgi:3-phenylpropionate/trans-cinnamate dioxygenase ferredoxin component
MATADGFEPVGRLEELVDGVPIGVVTPGGECVCLVKVRGRVHAVRDGCTHQAFPLSAGDALPDGTIQCAWHGARFDLATGAVRGGPACEPVAVYDVRVEDGTVWVRARGEGPGTRVEGSAPTRSEHQV